MRTSLFLKIFLGFWLVTVAILGSWMLLNQYFDDQPFAQPPPMAQEGPPMAQEGPPRRFMLRFIYGLQNAPRERLPLLLDTASHEHQVSIWLLDSNARDIRALDVPPDVADLASELGRGMRQASSRGKHAQLVGYYIYREDGPLRLVVALPPPRHRVLGALGANPALRTLLAILVSGLVCYGLSLLVTRRLRELGRASHRLAEGDLAARLDVSPRGGDETDQLARDFNAMAEQLQGRIQAQKRLLSDVSHELRSPLARLRVALALAQDAPERQQQYLERMEQETERLEELIGQLLSSQPQRLTLDTHIDLISLLAQLCADASFEGSADGKSVRLETSLEEALAASHGDLLQKCFDNLLRNAVRYTDAGSTVTVTLTRAGENWQIAVEDRGPGVPEEELSRIFDEFYRVDSARSREQGGHGLGLAIARRAVIQHGGEMRAENTGTGLRLLVSLPASQD